MIYTYILAQCSLTLSSTLDMIMVSFHEQIQYLLLLCLEDILSLPVFVFRQFIHQRINRSKVNTYNRCIYTYTDLPRKKSLLNHSPSRKCFIDRKAGGKNHDKFRTFRNFFFFQIVYEIPVFSSFVFMLSWSKK